VRLNLNRKKRTHLTATAGATREHRPEEQRGGVAAGCCQLPSQAGRRAPLHASTERHAQDPPRVLKNSNCCHCHKLRQTKTEKSSSITAERRCRRWSDHQPPHPSAHAPAAASLRRRWQLLRDLHQQRRVISPVRRRRRWWRRRLCPRPGRTGPMCRRTAPRRRSSWAWFRSPPTPPWGADSMRMVSLGGSYRSRAAFVWASARSLMTLWLVPPTAANENAWKRTGRIAGAGEEPRSKLGGLV
jgi:hypothetical protein